MPQLFIIFPEFTKFTEFPSHLEKTPVIPMLVDCLESGKTKTDEQLVRKDFRIPGVITLGACTNNN